MCALTKRSVTLKAEYDAHMPLKQMNNFIRFARCMEYRCPQ